MKSGGLGRLRKAGQEQELPLAKGGEERLTAEGNTYYCNRTTNQSTWSRPSAWDSATTPEGNTYYVNRETKESTWTHPGSAPAAARKQMGIGQVLSCEDLGGDDLSNLPPPAYRSRTPSPPALPRSRTPSPTPMANYNAGIRSHVAKSHASNPEAISLALDPTRGRPSPESHNAQSQVRGGSACLTYFFFASLRQARALGVRRLFPARP